MVANMVQAGLWGWPDGLPARRETGNWKTRSHKLKVVKLV